MNFFHLSYQDFLKKIVHEYNNQSRPEPFAFYNIHCVKLKNWHNNKEDFTLLE